MTKHIFRPDEDFWCEVKQIVMLPWPDEYQGFDRLEQEILEFMKYQYFWCSDFSEAIPMKLKQELKDYFKDHIEYHVKADRPRQAHFCSRCSYVKVTEIFEKYQDFCRLQLWAVR